MQGDLAILADRADMIDSGAAFVAAADQLRDAYSHSVQFGSHSGMDLQLAISKLLQAASDTLRTEPGALQSTALCKTLLKQHVQPAVLQLLAVPFGLEQYWPVVQQQVSDAINKAVVPPSTDELLLAAALRSLARQLPDLGSAAFQLRKDELSLSLKAQQQHLAQIPAAFKQPFSQPLFAGTLTSGQLGAMTMPSMSSGSIASGSRAFLGSQPICHTWDGHQCFYELLNPGQPCKWKAYHVPGKNTQDPSKCTRLLQQQQRRQSLQLQQPQPQPPQAAQGFPSLQGSVAGSKR